MSITSNAGGSTGVVMIGLGVTSANFFFEGVSYFAFAVFF